MIEISVEVLLSAAPGVAQSRSPGFASSFEQKSPRAGLAGCSVARGRA
jgi:hypothetical protein